MSDKCLRAGMMGCDSSRRSSWLKYVCAMVRALY